MLFLQLQQPNVEIPPDSVIINKIAENTQKFIGLSWHDKANVILDGAVDVGLKLIAAIAVFIIGRWLIKRIDRLIDRIFTRREVDTSLNTFIRNMLRIISWLILLMIVISILGIKTTSFVAVLASAGFAIGMALSGTLQNFAGGVMILLLKPFRTGDYIAAQGYEGTVKEIKLFNTAIVTSDNKTIIVPNGGLSTSIVNNFSEAGTRRVEWLFGIANGESYDTAKCVLKTLLDQEKRILEKPPYFIALSSIDASIITIVVRAWTNSSDFWDVYYSMNEKVYKIFPEHGLTPPANQIDVRLTQVETKAPQAKNEKSPEKTVEAVKKSAQAIGDSEMKSEDNSIKKEDLDIKDDRPAPGVTADDKED